MLLDLRAAAASLAPADVLVAGLFGTLVALIGYCVYQRFFSPLANFPGPFLASVTNLWFAWENTLPDHHRRAIALHEKYGPVVRVKPNKLSIASPEGFKIIYAAGTGYIKAEWYDVMRGKNRPFDMVGERDEKVHGHHRRLVSRAYAMDTMKSLEPYVDTTINVFLDKFGEAAKKDPRGVVDFSYWIQMFAFDVMGELSFARRFGLLDAGTDAGLFARTGGVLASAAWVGEAPWISSFHNTFIQPVFGPRLGLAQRNGGLHAFTLDVIAQRRARAGTPDDHEGDILSKFFAARRDRDETKGGLSEVDIGFMSTTNVIAGSDTTSVSLCAMVYHLLANPAKLERLKAELRERVASGEIDGSSGVVTHAQAERWPYLQACMYEAMRLHPVTGGLLARVVPPRGLAFGGHFVPAGVEVGTNPWVIQREKSVYGDDVESFRPERWLDEERKHEMHRLFFAFGGGSRTCIGRNISWLEMSKMIPTLFMHFDLQFANPKEHPKETFQGVVALKPFNVVIRRKKIVE